MSEITSIKDLTTELENQLKRLEIIQDEIGYSKEIKHDKSIELLKSISTFITSQVDLVVKEKEDLIQEIENAHTMITKYKKLMGEFASNRPVLDSTHSIQTNLRDLQQELTQVEEKYDSRLIHVKELYIQLEDFEKAMGDFVNTSMLMESEIDVSTLAVITLEEEIQKCEIEYVNRKESVEDGVKQISNLLAILGLEPESTQDKLIDQYYHEKNPKNKMELCNQLVSNSNLRYIATRINELEEIRQQVEFRKEEITQNLKHLWRRLHVDSKQCEIFLMSNRGLTSQELEQYEIELNKLLVLKQERIGEFIQTAREELNGLWDQLYYSENQKKQFQPAFTKESTDIILEAHENEISRLQLEQEDSKHILERIEKHMKLKKEVQEFEATTRDPNRLFSKGQRDPGRLLREEKFRKRISRELPKVIKELEGSLLEYEAIKGHPFLVYGKPYFDVIYEEQQENQKPAEPPVAEAPRTPKRQIEARKPMTSPRAVKQVRRMFNTPQTHRVRSVQLEKVVVDNSVSVLHQVREHNIKKRKQQKVIKRGHIFDESDDEEEEEEETSQELHIPPPPPVLKTTQNRKRLAMIESDDDLDLGIFDDGPDLSDMSEIDA